LAKGYYNQGKLAQAAEFFSKAGYAYWNKSNSPKAAEVFQKAYDIFSNQNSVNASLTVSNNLGLIYLDNENYKNAYVAFSNALVYSKKSKNQVEIFNSLINLGMVSLELSNYNDATARANEALVIAKELNNLKSLAKCYSLFAESYEKMGDASSAYKYFELYSSVDQKIKSMEMDALKNMSAEEIGKANEKKRVTEIELKIKKGELKLTQDSLVVSERIAYERQMQIDLRNSQLREKEVQLRYERFIRKTLIFGIIFITSFLIMLVYLLVQKLRDNKTLKIQKEEITDQRNKLDIQNKKITDSILYGLRIQQAMLPGISKFERYFETFILYRPKDIVSGDFYWYYEIEVGALTYCFIAVVDCTGHGVPGAFMSMIGNRLLTEIIGEHQVYQPSVILAKINNGLRHELDQDKNKSMDGMDISLCRIAIQNKKYKEFIYAGAKRPLHKYGIKGDFEVIEGDHKTIGGFIAQEDKTFSETTTQINAGDLFVMFTDGVIDQPNTDRSRYGTSRFTKAISAIKDKPMDSIKAHLEMDFELYRGDEEQRDDVTVLGLRLKNTLQ
jgi:serine phosphatase RsbU (regulator of sigma subunit)